MKETTEEKITATCSDCENKSAHTIQYIENDGGIIRFIEVECLTCGSGELNPFKIAAELGEDFAPITNSKDGWAIEGALSDGRESIVRNNTGDEIHGLDREIRKP